MFNFKLAQKVQTYRNLFSLFFRQVIDLIFFFLPRIGITGNQAGLRTPSHLVSASGHETPLHYATEGTPAIFSRNDSLSSLGSDDEAPDRRGKTIIIWASNLNWNSYTKNWQKILVNKFTKNKIMNLWSSSNFQHLPRIRFYCMQ